jgi:hypothetical protein
MRGVWSPVVGSGAAYVMEDKRAGKVEMEVAVVGSEAVAGKTGHWIEVMVSSKEGAFLGKNLMVLEEKNVRIVRMIVQMPGEGPMEFSGEMMNMAGGATPQPSDIRNDATHVGTETITVPGGTFTCEHYRTKDGDVWISEKVAPYGLVKMTSPQGTTTLVRVISGAQSRIKGTPKKFDMSEMMGKRP